MTHPFPTRRCSGLFSAAICPTDLRPRVSDELGGHGAVQIRRNCRFKSGTGSNLNLRTQKGRPVGTADLRDLASQFEMVAGAGNHLCRTRVSWRSEEHTSELQSLMRTSYAVY